MSVTDSTHTSELAARAKKITERELVTYSERTKGSQKATERARKVLPAGVPSSFQAYDPHPIVVKHAAGAHMVDVGDKPVSRRRAVAEGRIRMHPGTLEAIRDGAVPKGDVLAVARLAAIGGAKRTAETIPLCHPLPLTSIKVDVELEDGHP